MSNPAHLINGQWVEGSGPLFTVVNPANGQQIWSGHEAGAVEVEQACAAAAKAFETWPETELEARIAIVTRFRDLLKENNEELARIISMEVGKPLWEARTEVTTMANKVDISIQAYSARTGTSASKIADGDAILRHRPHGVFGVFGPYNFPGHLPNGHIVPALIAGNTIVFKPSEYAPQTAIRTMQLWQQAGLPDGVINMLNGARDTGVALSQNDTLDGILFTGSSQTGAHLHKNYGGKPGKMLALEMGGNNALVVWEPEDIDAAVHHIVFSAFVSAGQRCTCARRLVIEDTPRGQQILDRLVDVASRLQIGAPDAAPAPFMGPVVSSAIAKRLVQAQQDLAERGGKVLLPMRLLQENTGFVSAGIVDVTGVTGIPDEEWFGPLLQVMRVPDFDTALKVANATEFGLSAALLSKNPELWKTFQRRARAGVINWNRPTNGASSTAPFGGVGKSGNHRPSAFYAADYCAYPVASVENPVLEMPKTLSPGLVF
ncbi:MAG TPA: succinylglutamate-semialdehyde dehydrogenase [Burkholderiaceae bacterium]